MKNWIIQYKWNSLEVRDQISMQAPSYASPVTWIDYKKDFSTVFSAEVWIKNSLPIIFRKEMKRGREWRITDGESCCDLDLENI